MADNRWYLHFKMRLPLVKQKKINIKLLDKPLLLVEDILFNLVIVNLSFPANLLHLLTYKFNSFYFLSPQNCKLYLCGCKLDVIVEYPSKRQVERGAAEALGDSKSSSPSPLFTLLSFPPPTLSSSYSYSLFFLLLFPPPFLFFSQCSLSPSSFIRLQTSLFSSFSFLLISFVSILVSLLHSSLLFCFMGRIRSTN